MDITLTASGEGLLQVALARHPGQSPTEIVEHALAERVAREAQVNKLTPAQFDAWLNEFTQFSPKIPGMPGETFSREMIYQDHD